MALPDPLERLVRRSPAARSLRIALERLRDSAPGALERLEADARLSAALESVVVSSRSLSRVVLTEPSALEVMSGALEGTSTPDADPRSATSVGDISRRKHLGLLKIATRDLAGLDGLDEVGEALSLLADAAFDAACRFVAEGAGSAGLPLAVVAMGKHGAMELNYASDVDVLLVGADPQGVARRLLSIASESFRVDTDLRPEGRSGVLVRSLDSYRAYWGRWARPWEFQALLKARAAAGDPELGSEFEEAAAEALWQRRLDADDLAELRAMKARSESAVAARGLAEREIKRGRGGIRDIEFSVQLLQLVHGGADPDLRLKATLPALAELAAAGYVDGGDAAALSIAYRFLRTVEHRLQLVEEAQVHILPGDAAALKALSESLDLGGGSPERFGEVLRLYQASARAIHERLFFRPLLEAFGGAFGGGAFGGGAFGGGAFGGGAFGGGAPPAGWSEEMAEQRLAAFGFVRADRTRQALFELTSGLTRSSRLMQQMLPVLLSFLSEAPQPDEGLFALRTFVSSPHRRDVLVAGFRDSPELARRLCFLLGTGRQLAHLVGSHPGTALGLGDDAELAPPDPDEIRERAVLGADTASPRAGSVLRHLVESETLRIAAADLLGLASLEETSRSLSALGDAALSASLHRAAPRVPMGVFALGRLGGRELSFGSDLDVVVVHGGHGAADAAEAEAAAAALFGFLNGATPAERILTVDASLRPEGRQGPLARSLEAHVEYHARRIESWERQALLRLRPVAGDKEVLEAFTKLCASTTFEPPFGEAEVRDLRRMKARVERERIPAGEDPEFHLKLGRGSLSDVEWTTQLLQLRHGVRQTSTLAAVGGLQAGGFLDPATAQVLEEAYRFLSTTRNRWHLVGNHIAGAGGIVTRVGSDSLPAERARLSGLARALSTTPVELREEYRRQTRRARRVTEELFYGL